MSRFQRARIGSRHGKHSFEEFSDFSPYGSSQKTNARISSPTVSCREKADLDLAMALSLSLEEEEKKKKLKSDADNESSDGVTDVPASEFPMLIASGDASRREFDTSVALARHVSECHSERDDQTPKEWEWVSSDLTDGEDVTEGDMATWEVVDGVSQSEH